MSTRSIGQINASKINGSLSSGPVTAEGKSKSSLNSLRHGLQSKLVVLPNELPSAFDELRQSFIDYYQPTAAAEVLLIEEMAVHQWRIRRIWTIENTDLTTSFNANTDKDLTPDQILVKLEIRNSLYPFTETLRRHEDRLSRLFNRAARRLEAMQKQNTPNEPKTQKIQNEPNEPKVEEMQNRPNEPKPTPITSQKTGRNAPCPCRSGKKYKRCCAVG